jgi:hypothetical protein
VFEEGAKVYRQRFIGRRTSVLWESVTQLNGQVWQMSGLTGNYLRVETVAAQPLWNEISRVKLQKLCDNGLHGRILNIDP